MRVRINVWIVIAVPLTVVWALLGVVMLVYSSEMLDLILGAVMILTTVLPLRIVLRYFLVTSETGLWWFRGHLRWQDVGGFLVHEWQGGMLPQYVVTVVGRELSADLFATARYRRRSTEAIVDQLEEERRRRFSDG